MVVDGNRGVGLFGDIEDKTSSAIRILTEDKDSYGLHTRTVPGSEENLKYKQV